MINKALITEGQPGQLIGLPALTYMSTSIVYFIPLILLLAFQKTPPNARGTIYEGNLLSSIMMEQTIRQAAFASLETFKGTKGKFEAWTESIKNAAQISDQNTILRTSSKLTVSLLSTANRLKKITQAHVDKT